MTTRTHKEQRLQLGGRRLPKQVSGGNGIAHAARSAFGVIHGPLGVTPVDDRNTSYPSKLYRRHTEGATQDLNSSFSCNLSHLGTRHSANACRIGCRSMFTGAGPCCLFGKGDCPGVQRMPVHLGGCFNFPQQHRPEQVSRFKEVNQAACVIRRRR